MAGTYPASRLERDRWVEARRVESRAKLDPARPFAFHLEVEPGKQLLPCLTGVIFLANRECPWRCVMCDLWQNTLEESVPVGAIPMQIEFALSRFPDLPAQIKLYNSGSFFDHRAIPVEDYAEIAGKVSFAKRVIVESHPALVGHRVTSFHDMLSAGLEVALGLETIHPAALQQLNKGITLDAFNRACEFLRRHRIGIRVFLLVNPPFIHPAERQEWVAKSVAYSFAQGAEVVSLILTRGNNGPLEALKAEGLFYAADLSDLQEALEIGLRINSGRVFADTWGLENFPGCRACFPAIKARIEKMNLTQQIDSPVVCTHEAAV